MGVSETNTALLAAVCIPVGERDSIRRVRANLSERGTFEPRGLEGEEGPATPRTFRLGEQHLQRPCLGQERHVSEE